MAWPETVAWIFLAYLFVPIAILFIWWIWLGIRRLMGRGGGTAGAEDDET